MVFPVAFYVGCKYFRLRIIMIFFELFVFFVGNAFGIVFNVLSIEA